MAKEAKPKKEFKPIEKHVLETFFTDVDTRAEQQGDVSASIARLYKEFGQAYGLNIEAAKLIRKLRNMDPNKRADFLRGFDEYRTTLNLDDQLDLFGEDGDNVHPIAAE